MASYERVFKQSVAEDLRDIPKQDIERILQCIQALTDDARPAGGEKLSSQERYRVRQGDYRIVYEIRDGRLIVLIVKVGHRRDVYRT
ncbi:MAG: type II toxin-antitoxin system RelE/ParE family toxin [Gammaproteobacteria bacterium]|nr:type II toxin-antitoxin system RelE/ParE family toxin [Gammaproteobacteria bacterium]